MTLTLSNGHTVQIAEFCPRGVHKQMQKKLMGEETVNTSEASQGSLNFSFRSAQEAEDYLLCELVTEITTKDGEEVPVKVEYFDGLSMQDFNKIKVEIDKLTKIDSDLGKE